MSTRCKLEGDTVQGMVCRAPGPPNCKGVQGLENHDNLNVSVINCTGGAFTPQVLGVKECRQWCAGPRVKECRAWRIT